MNQFPLYPYHSDPFRILSPRRIIEEHPAVPDPPPPGEGTHPEDGGGAPSNDPATAASPAPPPATDAARRPRVWKGGSAGIPDAAYWETPPAPPVEEAPPAPAAEPESPDAERIRLMRAWINKHWSLVEAMARAGETPQRPSPPPPPAPAAPPPRVHVARGDRWTKHRMTDFLRHLAAIGSVTAAARAVGMSRQSAHKLRARLKGQPFDVAWEAAFHHGYDNLAHAALDRALNGVEVPHYHDGKLVGTSRKYDERLTVALLKMRNREGAPLMVRYGAAAEYYSERWDALLERIETGSVDWSDEYAALGPDGVARLELPDDKAQVDALIVKHLPDEPARRGR